ncbi:MAG: hypothetical protein OEL81_00880 [Nitrosopumilus sp.]|nr:hypothetical protein [Nitrosopumilus sp.]
MKTRFLIIIGLVTVGTMIAFTIGAMEYQSVYNQNCNSDGGYVVGFLKCTYINEDYSSSYYEHAQYMVEQYFMDALNETHDDNLQVNIFVVIKSQNNTSQYDNHCGFAHLEREEVWFDADFAENRIVKAHFVDPPSPYCEDDDHSCFCDLQEELTGERVSYEEFFREHVSQTCPIIPMPDEATSFDPTKCEWQERKITQNDEKIADDSGWITGEDYCQEWCDNDELYQMGCDQPILAHLAKYSNLFDDDFNGEFFIDLIGLPDGVSQEKFEWCVDFIYEKRLFNVTVLDCNIPDNPHKEYQCFRESFSNCQLSKVDPDIYTIEGSPIYTNVTTTNDCKIYGIIDTTTDVHGDRGIIRTTCETLTDDQYGWNIKDCDALNYPEMQFNYEMQLYQQILECEENGNTWVREKLECVED